MLASLTALAVVASAALALDVPLVSVAAVGAVAILAAAVVVLAIARGPFPASTHRATPRRRVFSQPAPSHPDTEGRARPRAPGRSVPAV
jgi:hypothetical protein